MPELWFPQAEVYHGSYNKRRTGVNPNDGAVLHSADGYAGGLFAGIRDSSYVGWHFSNMRDGRLFQHFATDVVLAHCADWDWPGDNDPVNGNGTLIGIENEGVAREPLTPAQLDNLKDLLPWLGEQGSWVPARGPKNRTLWEHRELSDIGTLCPSGRIPWAVVAPPMSPVFDLNRYARALQLQVATHKSLPIENGKHGWEIRFSQNV